MIPILVDLYGVLSIADTTVDFEREFVRQLKAKVRARIGALLQGTVRGLSPEPSVSPRGCSSSPARTTSAFAAAHR